MEETGGIFHMEMTTSLLNTFSFEGGAGMVAHDYTTNGEQGKSKSSSHFLEATDWADSEALSSDFSFYHDNSLEIKEFLSPADDQWFILPIDMHLDSPCLEPPEIPMAHQPPVAEDWHHQNQELSKKVGTQLKSLDSLQCLSRYGPGERRRLQGERLFGGANPLEPPPLAGSAVPPPRLSTEEVMRVAGARYIQFMVEPEDDDLWMLSHPFGSMLSTLTREEIEDVELAHLLLAAAEKVGNQQYDRASRLLAYCDRSASIVGNSVQRVVHHFADALRERIDRETGRWKTWEEQKKSCRGEDVNVKMTRPHLACLVSHRCIPFSRIMNLTEAQAILDSVASSKKIHLIDLGIRIGIQWTGLMQALSTRATCPVELLRITAVGTCKQTTTETGARLADFAKTLNLPFVFEEIIVPDMEDLKEDKFKSPKADESVVVYASLVFRTMLDRPYCLENLMRTIKRLNPCIMMVTEVDSNQNSLSFSNRFIEALFFYSAWFDCTGDCMSGDGRNRLDLEANFFSPCIRSIVATEGRERIVRHVGMDVWRTFLSRFGSVEMELSEAILYQASLIVKQFACGSSCTVDMKGNCLTIGWKGTPLICVSAWKLR